MTLEEIAVIVAESQQKQYDSSFLEMIEALVKVWRAKIIRQRLAESKNEREYFIQDLVVPVEQVTEAECSRLGLVEGCSARTCKELPTLVRTNIMYDYIGAENFRNPFGRSSSLRQLYNDYSLTKGLPIWVPRNKRIYIDNFKGDKIGVRGIWENPLEVSICNIKLDKGDNCDLEDIEYDCPDDVITDIINSILSTNMKFPKPKIDNTEVKQINE